MLPVIRTLLATSPFFVALLACGGTSFTSAIGGDNDGGGGGGPDATSDSGASDAAMMADVVPRNDAGTGSDAATTPDSGVDAGPPPCPDVRGAYSVAIQQGAGTGCLDLNPNAKQCIRQGLQAQCDILFVSTSSNVATAAINGGTTLQGDGSFTNASLKEGTQNRTGCTGTWNPGSSTMTVDCGGTSSTQSCVVALTRTNATCN